MARMNRFLAQLAACCCAFAVGATPAAERIFTDDRGRTVEASLIGVRDGNVVLEKNGRTAEWPVEKLSEKDRVYVANWLREVQNTPELRVQIWEREGIGAEGLLNEERLSPYRITDIPMVRKVEEKGDYRHYDIDVHNPSTVDAPGLQVVYILYVIAPDRRVIGERGTARIDDLGAGERRTVKSRGVTYVQTKTTTTTLSGTFLGFLLVGSETERSKETFGGAWVRVYDAGGRIVGEARDLIPQLEKLDPPWVEEPGPGGTVADFDELRERLAPVKQLLDSLRDSRTTERPTPP